MVSLKPPLLEPFLIRGDYEVIEFSVTEPDPDNVGQYRPRDITTDTFVFTAKTDINSDIADIQKTSESGITLVDATAGLAQVEILPEDTTGLTRATKYKCDVEGTAPGPPSKPYTYLFDIKVILDVSN